MVAWVESDFKAPNLPLSLRFKGKLKIERHEPHHKPGANFVTLVLPLVISHE
jgi:hypothetical protein